MSSTIHKLVERINIPIGLGSDPGLVAASKQDPWKDSGKYALGWVYFSIILLVATVLIRLYHLWTDKIRRALHKEEAGKAAKTESPDSDYEMTNLQSGTSERKFFPAVGDMPAEPEIESTLGSITAVNKAIALIRWVSYRPIPSLRFKKRSISFPSMGVAFIVSAAALFTVLYCFIPQPLFYQSIRFGSPPLAIRAGMISVAMMPWIVALSMKANMISMLTGIGHERLNVLHRWGGYICLLLALIHTVPFYVTPIYDQGAMQVFQNYFSGQYYVYGTGVAALTPLIFLCVHSLPILRSKMYELFVALHAPASIIFLGMMFWHCNNYLTSWNYLFATLGIWLLSYVIRMFYLNWTRFNRLSWLIGEEAALTILPENAVKVTIPTQMKWRPGQFVYLRMPGISIFENHPFTIASLWSDDFPSEYGEEYRDMTLVFRPFGGFTRKVINTALENGPEHTYRAFIDGPYGGMQRELTSFDTIIFFAGGSGITAIVSQLLELIKKMRDGRAVTKQIHVVWALKRPDIAEWFREELRICRQFAPLESVHCQFFITAAKRLDPNSKHLTGGDRPTRPVSQILHESINNAFQGIASKRNSALIREEAAGDLEKERELRAENEDTISTLPRAYLTPAGMPKLHQPPSPRRNVSMHVPLPPSTPPNPRGPEFDFGFPSTPTTFQKSLMRFAFMPAIGTSAAVTSSKSGRPTSGWHTEYGRPDIPFMLREFARGFGRRTCVFVCGPEGMRVDVQRAVAGLQKGVLSGSLKTVGGGRVDELFLHTENYAI
jgi:predicted ferric reductase